MEPLEPPGSWVAAFAAQSPPCWKGAPLAAHELFYLTRSFSRGISPHSFIAHRFAQCKSIIELFLTRTVRSKNNYANAVEFNCRLESAQTSREALTEHRSLDPRCLRLRSRLGKAVRAARPTVSDMTLVEFGMKKTIKSASRDKAWRGAEEALAAARGMSAGAARVAALKEAGQLRFQADERRRARKERNDFAKAQREQELSPKLGETSQSREPRD